jgi:hypothetical protein
MRSYDPYIFLIAAVFFLSVFLVMRFQLIKSVRKYSLSQLKTAEKISLILFILNLVNFLRVMNWFVN